MAKRTQTKAAKKAAKKSTAPPGQSNYAKKKAARNAEQTPDRILTNSTKKGVVMEGQKNGG